jgi:hypothetical protein
MLALLLAAAALQTHALAHVGSPDVFLEGQAGAYRLLVTVRPPHAIPGVADVDVLTTSDGVRDVRIVPLPLTGPGAQFAPVADRAVRSPDDPRLFTGHLWMMGAGAWQVRVSVSGDQGEGMLSVPVPTLPQSTLEMGLPLRAMLVALMLLLAAGFIGIVSALAREARLAPGDAVDRPARVRGWIAGGAATVAVCAIVFLGNRWWSAEASTYNRYVYKPIAATATVTDDSRLKLYLTDPGWIASRRLDDFVPDHGHLMHLFVVSPGLDRLWHLHPREASTGLFEQRLPDLAAGQYELFADVVHATGMSETVVGRLATNAVRGTPLTGDDSAWEEVRLKPDTTETRTREQVRLKPDTTEARTKEQVRLKPDTTEARTTEQVRLKPDTTEVRTGTAVPVVSGFSRTVSGGALEDGGRIVWVRDNKPLVTKQLTMFTFRVEDAQGRPAGDLELYMGMPGHAIFVKRDRTVFAHVHPSGSAPMAAMTIAMPVDPVHAQHMATAATTPSTVTFPYGLPESGDYRIFVQVKRAGLVMTAAFDATVP